MAGSILFSCPEICLHSANHHDHVLSSGRWADLFHWLLVSITHIQRAVPRTFLFSMFSRCSFWSLELGLLVDIFGRSLRAVGSDAHVGHCIRWIAVAQPCMKTSGRWSWQDSSLGFSTFWSGIPRAFLHRLEKRKVIRIFTRTIEIPRLKSQLGWVFLRWDIL